MIISLEAKMLKRARTFRIMFSLRFPPKGATLISRPKSCIVKINAPVGNHLATVCSPIMRSANAREPLLADAGIEIGVAVRDRE